MPGRGLWLILPQADVMWKNEVILNKGIVTIAGKSVFYRSLYKAEVKHIKDLMSKSGNLPTLSSLFSLVLKLTSCNI